MSRCGCIEYMYESGDAISEFGFIILFGFHFYNLVSNFGYESDKL